MSRYTLESIAPVFWQRVEKGPDCWTWLPKTGKLGYGSFSKRFGEKVLRMNASRWAWLLTHGKLPTRDVFVCHRCDNPVCVRPDHLFLGTASDNMKDCARKGRLWFQKNPAALRRGANHPKVLRPELVMRGDSTRAAKLLSSNVLEIRRLLNEKTPYKYLALRFGVSVSLLEKIKARKLWSHI